MSFPADLKTFIEEERKKLAQEKLRFEHNHKQTKIGTKTNDLKTENSEVCNVNSENSKLISDGLVPLPKPRLPLSDLNEDVSKQTVKKSAIVDIAVDSRQLSTANDRNSTDVVADRRDMSTVSRYTTTSNPPCRRSQSEGVSSLSKLGAEYEQRKRELLLARNKDYKEYLAKQKLLEQRGKSKRQYDISHDDDDDQTIDGDYYHPTFTSATATQTSNGHKADTSSDHSSTRHRKCTIAVQTEPLRSLNDRSRSNRPACRNRSLDLISYGGGDSHDWEDEYAESERVVAKRRQRNDFAMANPKTISKRKMIEQLRSSYYPSFGDSFETPEERKVRMAKEEARKREIYQMELNEQIREKRLEMEAKQRKELEEEEALARRLEAQIQNMQMERDLEILSQENRKEKMRKNSIRFNERKKQLQLEVEQEKERLRQARKACPHNLQNTPSTSVIMPRCKSPPIPTLKNRIPTFSTNIERDSIFNKSHNKNSDSLADQIRKLKTDTSSQDVYKSYEIDSTVSEDYNMKVGSWKVSNNYRDDRNNFVRRSVSEESTSPSRSNSVESDYNEGDNKRRGYSETSIPNTQNEQNDDVHDTNCLTKVLSDEKFATKSILTQLGAIRRQLQMTQIELDERLSKS